MDARAACDRASQLTRSLLAFSRKSVLAAEVVSLPELLRATRAMLERAVGESVRVALELPGACPAVEVDPAQFQLVLVNLAVNARAAMPRGGALTIRARPGTAADARAAAIDGESVVLVEVSDTGVGIAPDVLPRIFEPFFTTKARGEGSGFGLATCHAIVSQAGGALRARSDAGAGATSTIYLPGSARSPAARPAPRTTSTVGGTERILVVEDDAVVRRTTVRMLEAGGYTVLPAASVADARAVATGAPFDLLLSDVRLPDGNGAALAAELRRARGDLPVLLISGYVDDEARAAIDARALALLHKPFNADALARAVRSALDAKPGG